MRIAALLAGLAGALLLPLGRPGIGVLVVVLLGCVTVAFTWRPRLDTLLFGSLAVALASVAVFRDAGWLVAVDLAAAWCLACAAIAGPRIGALAAPFMGAGDASDVVPPAPKSVAHMIGGTVIGVCLVAVFAMLFVSADAAFAELWARIPTPSMDSAAARAFTFVLVVVAALGFALAARRTPRAAALERTEELGPWVWAIPLALLDLLFAAFVAVQLVVLFGGHDHVLHTAGLTYAEYAHQGFWQLVAVAVLTLVVIAVAVRSAETPRRSHRVLLRALLGILCALTLVIVASVLQRLSVYEDTFGLTRLRLAVDAFTLWLGGLFVLALAAGTSAWVRRQLPRIVLAGSAAWLLAFSLANPDLLVAERNLDRWRDTGKIDVDYLRTLSADAVPALATLPVQYHDDALWAIEERLEADEPLGSWNLSRARARRLL